MKRLAVIAALLLCAQSPLAFEVASVKQIDTTDPRGIRGGYCRGTDNATMGGPITPALGRCRFVGLTLKNLVARAYRISEDRISGGPGWAETLPYTIDAKSDDNAAATQALLLDMVQTLLSDRFKVKFHRETKEVSGYILIATKDGPRLKEQADPKPAGSSPPNEHGTRSVTGHSSVAGFASMLSSMLHAPVTDSTGVTGSFYYTLKWTPGEGETGYAADADPGPSIFTALQEQLGLRLEARKTSIETLVIDSAEKPVENN